MHLVYRHAREKKCGRGGPWPEGESAAALSERTKEWLDGYRSAWEGRDPDAAARLFTENASYRTTPYEEPFRGRDAVRAYWAEVTSTQSDVRLRYGTPVADGCHAAVEWWVTMRNSGADVTLAGEFFLRFDASGVCEELREYWHFSEGRLEPFESWGR